MHSAVRWLAIAIAALSLISAASAKDGKDKGKKSVPIDVQKGEADLDQIREELGVNGFTAPSIEHLLAELMDLRPIPIEKVWRDVPPEMPDTRAKIALRSGRIIADGLLAVIAEKPSRVEPPARALVRYAKALGVADHITKHSKSLLEKAAKENWLDLRKELVRSQADIEAGMLGLKDEEIAHMVSLGGWFRGLEVVSALVETDYTPEHARILVQPEAIEYFLDRIGTLDPTMKAEAVFQKIESALKAVKGSITKENEAAPTAEDVKEIRKQAAEVVDLL